MECWLFLCLVALSAGAVSAQFYPTVTLNRVLGGSVAFTLLHETIPSDRLITWRTGGGAIFIARILNNGNPQYNANYNNRCELFPNGTLRLDNLTRDDERAYAATIENQIDFTTQTANYQLNVYAVLNAPELRIVSNSTRFISGNNLTLHCDAGNQNVTTYTFYHNQKPVCSEPHVTCNGSFLHFLPLMENDAGSYFCTIMNPVSTNTSNSQSLTITVRVSGIKLEVNTTALVWPGRDSVSLHCSANGTSVIYSWHLDGAPLPIEPRYQLYENNSLLLISPVSAKDNGSFTCTASNDINSETSDKVILDLASPVSEVTVTSNTSEVLWEGQNSVFLHCSARGSAVNFTWSLDGKLLSSNPPYQITQSYSPPNSNLTISPVSRNDNGIIICTAKNLENQLNSTAPKLDINWYPDGNISCGVNATENMFEFICTWANGNPPANVTMTFNGTNETRPNIVSKEVNSNTHIQGSNFTCTGNQLGKESTCVTIFEPPQSSGHDNNTLTNATEGESVLLPVKLYSTPTSRTIRTVQVLPAKFIWYRYTPARTEIRSNGEFIVNSTNYASTLNITKVTEAYSGKYECEASNLVGNKVFIFNVKVNAKPNPPDNGLSGGAIAGIVIGVLAGLTIIAIVVYFILKKN